MENSKGLRDGTTGSQTEGAFSARGNEQGAFPEMWPENADVAEEVWGQAYRAL